MAYPTYLFHFNRNHDLKTGRFVPGDGDGKPNNKKFKTDIFKKTARERKNTLLNTGKIEKVDSTKEKSIFTRKPVKIADNNVKYWIFRKHSDKKMSDMFMDSNNRAYTAGKKYVSNLINRRS